MPGATGTVPTASFDPAAVRTFRFLDRSLDGDGVATLRYGFDDSHIFAEHVVLPLAPGRSTADAATVDALLSLLHWVAGVSYYKAAVPGEVVCESGAPPPATRALLEALYTEGLGEFAVVNSLPGLPEPRFPEGAAARAATSEPAAPQRVLVPVGGGKDSAVAIEIVRRAGLEETLFSVGDAIPIRATAERAELPRLIARRTIDPALLELNAAGALNGHVPITAIVGCIALLTAALNGFDAVALANERSASSPNTVLGDVEVNHQFSKSFRAEQLLSAAVRELAPGTRIFSVLRPASELSIARAFARLPRYHDAFTSCNRVFRLDPERRLTSWCCDCDKCRFVFLILAPFMEPQRLAEIFGQPMLAEERQFEGFALLTATGGHKPFECVGEVEESVAAIRLLSRDPRWCEQPVVKRLAAEVLPRFPAQSPDGLFALSPEHAVPERLMGAVNALLAA